MDSASNISSDKTASARPVASDASSFVGDAQSASQLADKLLLDSGFHASKSEPTTDDSSWVRTIATVAGTGLGIAAAMPGRVGLAGKLLSAGLGLATASDMAVNEEHRVQDAGILAGIVGGFTAGKLTAIAGVEARLAGRANSGFTAEANALETLPGLKLKETKLTSEIATNSELPVPKSYSDYKAQAWRFTQPEVKVFENERTGTQIIYPTKEPDYSRISVQQAQSVSEHFPDPRLVRELRVSDVPHPDEVFMQSALDQPKLRIAADVQPDGRMTLYRPSTSENLAELGNHEWSHLHALSNPKASSLFDDLAKVEQFKSPSNALETIGTKEAWPKLAETFLGEDGVLAAATAMRNPLRSAVWSKAFEATLKDVPVALRSPAHDFYEKRLQLIQGASAPDVGPAIKAMEASSDATVRRTAEALKSYLAN